MTAMDLRELGLKHFLAETLCQFTVQGWPLHQVSLTFVRAELAIAAFCTL
jgi:hypothetical protein